MSIFIFINQNIPQYSICLSKFQKFSPASKTRNKQTKKWSNIVFLLTLFVYMILSIPGSGTMGTGTGTLTWVRVRVLHVKSHGYGSETESLGTGIQTSVSG